MTLSRYPESFDDDTNLYLVHDGLRLRLADDYTPGDTKIVVEADPVTFDKFPPTGIITLTEQCSEVGLRAISFNYGSKGEDGISFRDIELIDGFEDVEKPKRITNVTQNVFSLHHNALKDALIAIQEFVGIKGDIALTGLAGTMEARINFLRKLVLRPTAWFKPDVRIGKVPLTVTFKDLTTRLPSTWEWDFGDGDTETLTGVTDGSVEHVYADPDIYDVTLTVTNEFGSNTLTLEELIHARAGAPSAASIALSPGPLQALSGGVLRSVTNSTIELEVDDSGAQVEDPVLRYTWILGDDLPHSSASSTKASYGVGGIYDIRLRVDTTLGAYRVTTFEDALDIVETTNLWFGVFDSAESNTAVTKNASFYEFGLVSETFKAVTRSLEPVTRDYTFLSGTQEETRAKREFRRNNGFKARNLVGSGNHGEALVFWAEGAAVPAGTQTIRFRQYNGFDDTWSVPDINGTGDTMDRNWNWTAWPTTTSLYFIFGSSTIGAVGSPTMQDLTTLSLDNLSVTTEALDTGFYANGADELMYDVGGGNSGNFSVYRSAWQSDQGYLLRNDGVGEYFRLKSFYITLSAAGDPISQLVKVGGMPGHTKFEGQLVALFNGIYFFNNTGEVIIYLPDSESWGSGGPGVGSPGFSTMQDNTIAGFDSDTQTFTAVSDGDRSAYLSFDYTANSFLRFDETNGTFSKLPTRPTGEQFVLGIY